MRYPRGAGTGVEPDQGLDTVPIGEAMIRHKGSKPIAILAFGVLLQKVLPLAERWDVTIVDMRFVKPIDKACIIELAKASGSLGMVGGQSLDLAYTNQDPSLEQLQQMHRLKTGALIEVSVHLGAVAGGASYEDRLALETFGSLLGLAYQVVDDILDVSQDTKHLGKTAGKDVAANKATYVSEMGLEGARKYAKDLHDWALESILPFGPSATRLRALTDFVIKRSY